jgi:hypothetical protein
VRPWNVVVGAYADIPNATANRRVS